MAADGDVQNSVERLRRWVLDQALPLWGGIGFDSARGAFVERLTFEGAPLLSAPRRAMVQGRQIYVFSHAAMLGWWPEGNTIALEAAQRARSPVESPQLVQHGAVDPRPDELLEGRALLRVVAVNRADQRLEPAGEVVLHVTVGGYLARLAKDDALDDRRQ